MTRTERKILFSTALLGWALTALVAALDWADWLTLVETQLYDIRVRQCQFFTPPPSDAIVHVDIEDRSLEVVGHWPWPRQRLGEVMDELRLAGTKSVFWDIIWPEPDAYQMDQETILSAAAGGATRPATQSADIAGAKKVNVSLELVNQDIAFADGIRAFREAGGKPVIPTTLLLNVQAPSPAYAKLVELFRKNLMQSPAEAQAALESAGLRPGEAAAAVREGFEDARGEVILQRVAQAMQEGVDDAGLREKVFPGLDPNIGGSEFLRKLREEKLRYQAIEAMHQFTRPASRDLPPLFNSDRELATIPVLTSAAWKTGFVDYVPMNDGVVRSIPLFAIHRGQLVPQVGLVLACAMLDVDPRVVEVYEERVEIPTPDGRRIRLPVHRQQTPRGVHAGFFDIPWFGTEEWATMYDYPARQRFARHVPIHQVLEPLEFRRRIIGNNQRAREGLIYLWTILDGSQQKANELESARFDLSNADVFADLIRTSLEKLEKDVLELLPKDDTGLTADEKLMRDKLLATRSALQQIARQNPGLKAQMADRRASLKNQLGGKAVLIGWTAVGTIADVVPTPLHPRCPGVVAHGVVANAILNGDVWKRAPGWMSPVLTLLMGLLTTLLVARLSAWRALPAVAVVALIFALVNGIVLFDYGNLILPAAGPLGVIAVVWSFGTLNRFILESAERARIKAKFSKYVDPVLVDYAMERGDELAGEQKELTVVFTDLAGFTSLSEKLGPGIVPLLNEYFGQMVPIVRHNKGYVNKFIGDAIMFFFGAPIENQAHAAKAVQTVLEMRAVMPAFNETLEKRNLPTVAFRAGIASGQMVVGDAGSLNAVSQADRASDYTVLGDNVNLASRLEGANKFFGTGILLNQRGRDLLGERFLVRPVGKIQVKGQSSGLMTYEPLADMESATPELKEMAALTEAFVIPFTNGNFDRCMEAIARYEDRFGKCKLTQVYRELCEEYLKEPPPGFDGQIELKEK